MSDQPSHSSPTPPQPSGSSRQLPYGQFGGESPPALSPAPQYPQQQLLPQDVKPGRSRVPQVIGVLVVLAVLGGGLLAWFLLRDDGEDTRAQYCAELNELTDGGDLMGMVEGANESTLLQLETVADLAPGAVEADWQRLRDLAESADLTASSGLAAYAALQSIIRDAEDNCGIDIPLVSF